MKITVVYPKNSHTAYEIAADAFIDLCGRISDASAEKMTDADFLSLSAPSEYTVLIGHDAANDALASRMLDGKISAPGFRYGSDGYTVRTERIGETKYLILAGGRPRATIYAVYRYFEKFCGCRYFWDGDRIPHGALPFEDLDLNEEPRFTYRGLRYFAHRSLSRFQAEQWGFVDWKAEIDWILKSRLNLFMLRIGTDDLYQKAFPDVVPYPDRDRPLPEATKGYDDRNLFWSLQYRGELRKKILQYAFERDLMHPEDCGTMTHWYSRTPIAFLEKKKPSLLSQSTAGYSEQTGLVFDIRDKKNMEYYEHLTDTHVKEYGKSELFHTIGLAERMYSKDRDENQRMKLYTYRKITDNIREKYPNAKLLLASWDMCMCYTSEEVRALFAELDPERVILFDYTSEAQDENNFTKWNVIGKFPWIFGVFGGIKRHDDIRGNFALMNERLAIAKNDAMCRGMVFWPEFSHGNPLYLYYLARNAWEKDIPSIDEILTDFCAARYDKSTAELMRPIWEAMLPIAKQMTWKCDRKKEILIGDDLYQNVIDRAPFDPEKRAENEALLAGFMNTKKDALLVLSALQKIPLGDLQTERDAFDMARTVISRFINAAILKAEICFTKGDIAGQEKASRTAIDLLSLFAEVLGGHEDYSLLRSFERIKAETDTNPNFEITLKNNAECEYNRSHIYENAQYLYLPEVKIWLSEALTAAKAGRTPDRKVASAEIAKNKEGYFSTLLSEMKRESAPLASLINQAEESIRSFCIKGERNDTSESEKIYSS